ncbi:MAG: tetratricopeptide repeat protein [Desulfuromonadaceae bacterium]|nr:tetratricopeptide repeat protein [Desulfuromonadaceae bacterium]
MILLRLCRNNILRILVVLVIISSFTVASAFSQETEDSQIFIAGFNAYQQKDYATSIEKLTEVLQKYPDTTLRDMTLFWLSRSYFKAGNQQDAARYLSQFSKEYPDNPLKSTVEDELLALTARFEKGEKLAVGPLPVKQPDPMVAQKAKVEKEQIAVARAEEAKQAAVAAESARDAALRQAEENALAEQKELARAAAVSAELERIAQETATREKVAQLRAAAVKEEEARKVAEQIEQAKQQRIVAAKAEQERIAAEKAEKAKLAADAKAEQDRLAVAKAEEELRVKTATEAAHAAAQKAEREQIALARIAEAKQAEAAAETARMASLKAEEERRTADLAARESQRMQLAALKAEEARLAQQKLDEEKVRASKLAYREKAIDQYKTIMDKFPTSTAAVTAAAKLRELGIAVALPPQAVETPLPENAQVLKLEVAQFAGFEFNLLPRPEVFTAGQQIAVPFEITNRGNGIDSFSLESAFPTDFNAQFISAAAPDVTISHTTDLAPGEIFKGAVVIVIPPGSIDGLRITHPVKATSRLIAEASQTREVKLIASAPLLRAVLRTEKTKPLPGDKVLYRIAILNIGSSVAKDVTLRLNFPPQLEPVDSADSGFRQEMKSELVLDGMQVNSGENREFSVTFQLKDDSLAGQELSTRAELINNTQRTTAAFISNMAYVEQQRNISVRAGSERLVVIPGQTITAPFVVTNKGNGREKFTIVSVVSGTQDAVIFHDVNRDGIRQAGEPVINEIGPLAPREEVSIVVEIKTPKSAPDSSKGTVQISVGPEGDSVHSASGSTQLTYSRPVLHMAMSGRDGRLKPGDVASFDLSIANTGSNLAKLVELQSAWPEQLELVAAEPAVSAMSNGIVVWRFKDMGASEKRIIAVSFRVKPVTGVGTAIQVKNILTYEDQLGNRY